MYITIIRIKNFTLKYTEIFWMYYDLTLVLELNFSELIKEKSAKFNPATSSKSKTFA